MYMVEQCAVPENIHTPPTEVMEFPGGGMGGSVRRNVGSLIRISRAVVGSKKNPFCLWAQISANST